MAEQAPFIDTSNNIAGSLGDVALKGNKGQGESEKAIDKLRLDSQNLPMFDQRAIFSLTDEARLRANDLFGQVSLQGVNTQSGSDFSKYFHLDANTQPPPPFETIRLSAADTTQLKMVTPAPIEAPAPPAAAAPAPPEAPTPPAAAAPTPPEAPTPPAAAPTPPEAPTPPAAAAPRPAEAPTPPATPATAPADATSHPAEKKPELKAHEKDQSDKDLDLLRDKLKKAGALTVKSGHGYDSAADKIIELAGIKPKDLSKHDYQQLIDALKAANHLKTNLIIHGHEFQIDKHILESPIVKGLLKKLKDHSTEIVV